MNMGVATGNILSLVFAVFILLQDVHMSLSLYLSSSDPETNLPLRGHFAKSGNRLFYCYNLQGAGGRGASQHPAGPGTAPRTKNGLAPNVNSAKAEKPCSVATH